MSVDGIIPNLTASAAVSPYRFVLVTGDMTGAHADAQTNVAVGVSDGSIASFNGTYNAAVGDPIQLQQGPFMQVQVASSCDAGELLTSTTDGKAYPENAADPGAQYHMVALQAAASANAVIWAFWRPTVVVTVSADNVTIFGDGTVTNPLTTDGP